MARMKLLVAVSGDEVWIPGQIVEVDEETAAKWCDGERAERVDQSTSKPDPKTREPEPPKTVGPPGGEKAVQLPGGERRRTGRHKGA